MSNNMENLILVKKDSVKKFFKENVIGCEGLDLENQSHHNDSLYYLFKDELLIKKDVIKVAGSVHFELRGQSVHHSMRLLNKYTYSIERYDDVTSKMILTGFDIDLIKVPKPIKSPIIKNE